MADIEGVIIGGLIGITGSLIGPLILEWRKQLYAREEKRREKYEQFITTLYENDHWVKTFYRIRIEQSGESEQPPPHEKLEAIIQIYFPDLDPTVHPLINALDRFLSMIHVKGEKRRQTKEPLSRQDQEDLDKVGLEYHRSMQQVLAALREYSKREFPINKV